MATEGTSDGGETPSIGLDLRGAVSIVTGAGSQSAGVGIGSAVAVTLARHGARVALVDREPDAAERTRRAIESEGGTSSVFHGDVSQAEQCREIVSAVRADLGSPAVLVNNVGIAGPRGRVDEVDPDAWDDGMRINVKSMMLMSKFCVPLMAAEGQGSIVNTSSVAGLIGGHSSILYPVSKGAVIQMTRAMAAQHGEQGIRVNCVAPGMVYTPMVVGAGMPEEMREARRKGAPLRTEGTAWDVAAAVAFLASHMARWITGVVLPVDGGYSSVGATLPTPPRPAV